MHPSLETFMAALQSGEHQKVIMFGDSITFGSQVDPAFDHDIVFHRQWADAMRSRWATAQLEVLNKGIPGNKIADALARADKDVIAHKPDLVVIEFGINDCWNGPSGADDYESGLRQLVALLRAHSSAALILLTANMMNHAVTPEALKMAWFAETSSKAQTLGWMDEYMERMRTVARDTNLPLADGYAKYEQARAAGTDTDGLLANGANHPNEQGHRLLAEAIAEVLD